jgi:3-oxoadipate enol-lactonase
MKRNISTSDGESIACYIEGPEDADIVMLANSLGTDHRLWAPQMPVLTSHFRVLRYDARGHGASTVPQGEYTLDRLGADALDVLDALGIGHVSFSGISLGGMVGQWLAIHASQRLRSLALCNTSAYMGPLEAWQTRIATVRARGMSAMVQPVLERWFTPEFLSREPEAVRVTRNALLSTSPTGYAGCCAAIRDMDLRQLGSKITVPTLIIGGAFDPATPPAHAEALHAQISGSRLVMLPAAHLSNLEVPEEFTKQLFEFMRVPKASIAS